MYRRSFFATALAAVASLFIKKPVIAEERTFDSSLTLTDSIWLLPGGSFPVARLLIKSIQRVRKVGQYYTASAAKWFGEVDAVSGEQFTAHANYDLIHVVVRGEYGVWTIQLKNVKFALQQVNGSMRSFTCDSVDYGLMRDDHCNDVHARGNL